ncbi:putative ribonuclease H-like domain-containing protein, partial [Tanacetum coccineum]
MDDFYREKGIKREYSVARTPQQNGVAERKNRTLIEAARTMLADSKLPTTFWAEAVSTACYVQNRVLIVKPHNKTPYELFRGFKPAIGFMKPFGCHVTILNTLDNLGKFDGKSDEGFFVGYSLSSKAFRVYNTRTRKVQENLHIGFLENKPMIEGNGPKWLFDLDSLTQSMNYVPVVAGTFSNDFAGIQGVSESSTSSQQDQDNQDCIVMPIWKDASYFGDAAPRTDADDGLQDENDATEKSHDDSSLKDNEKVSTALPEVNTATPEDLVGPIPASEDTQVEDQEIELGNIPQSYAIPTTPTNAIFEGKVSSGSSQCLLLVSSLKKNQKEFKALSDQRYFKGKPSLGLWYSKDSPLELVAYTDSDYAGSCKDRKLLLPLMVTLRIFTEASLRRHLKLDDHDGQEVALFPTMLNVSEPSTSPSRITSSPSHSPEPSIEHSPDHTTAAVSFPSPTQPTQPSPGAEQHIPTPNESPLHAVHSHGSAEGSLKLNELTNLVTKLSERIEVLEDDLKKTKQTYSSAFTKLILRIKKLEFKVKTGKARQRARVVLSEDEEDDSSKQGRKLSDAEVQEKASTETEPIIQEVTPTEVIQDQGSSEKGNSEVSTAGATKGTASEVPVVSTAEVNISTAGRTVTYRRRSEEKRTRKDKGKAIMTEPEPKKKSKKELEQERLSFAEAIRLQEQMDEEQRAQIARDEEIARQWDEEEGQRAMSEAKSSKKIDWNDPSVIRYHALKMKPKTVAQARRNMVKYLKNQGNYKISDFKGMSYNEIRPIFEKVWDFNQHIEPMDLEHGSERMKSPEKIEEEDVDTQKEMKEVSKESGAKRKKSLPRKSTRSTVKRQKMELDDEKEDLKGYLDIVPREDVAEDVESLSTKYPIVDWKTYTLSENFMYYKIIRGDGSSKNYKILSEMLYDFDRQDIMELYRLVKERYSSSKPEGYDLMLWGDLHTLF